MTFVSIGILWMYLSQTRSFILVCLGPLIISSSFWQSPSSPEWSSVHFLEGTLLGSTQPVKFPTCFTLRPPTPTPPADPSGTR